jgi:hypothetical protein
MKYNKNVERNRMREVIVERKRIWTQALKQIQKLAAIHDPTGASFHIDPVITLENGDVVTVEALKRKQERERAEREAGEIGTVAKSQGSKQEGDSRNEDSASKATQAMGSNTMNGINLAWINLINTNPLKPKMSKTQQKKLAKFEPLPPPPKPCIPDGISLPLEEENWLALWDLSDEQMERRILGKKKRKAAERKAFRLKQQEMKDERRAARDEKRKVYREIKELWKGIKAKETAFKRRIESLVQEESRRVAVEVNQHERRLAMGRCAQLGFTLDNVEGIEDIKPKISGVKGQNIDFDKFEFGPGPSELRLKTKPSKFNVTEVRTDRINLGAAPDDSNTVHMSATGANAIAPGDFISLGDVSNDREFQELILNHRLRRKVHRAMEHTQMAKEALVREKATEYCEREGLPIPVEFQSLVKVKRSKGHRVLPDGTIETSKQERVRARVELAERNRFTKVLRAQAKDRATKAGLETYAQLTGKIEKSSGDSKKSDKSLKEGDNTSNLFEYSSLSESSEVDDGPLKKRRKIGKTSSGSESSESEESSEGSESDSQSPRPAPRKNGPKPQIRTQLRASNWNSEALAGDEERKDKFLRLLGAGKNGLTNDVNGTESTEGVSNISRRETELEKQFEAGRHSKANGKKRGLGA